MHGVNRHEFLFSMHYNTITPHHAALPHLVPGAGRADDLFGDAVEERPSVLVLLLGLAVGRVPRRHHGVLEVQAAAVSTDLSSRECQTRSTVSVHDT